MDDARPLLEIRNLRLSFETPQGRVPVVRGVDLPVDRGETLALVGESGSGKSVTALAVLDLLPRPPARIESGEVCLDGIDLLAGGGREARRARGRRIAMVFQDPLAALNPHLEIGRQVLESLLLHTTLRGRRARDRAVELLHEVGLPDPERRLRIHPHQLSGGQRQRALLAMALAGEPDLLIADEPTTALDVTVQAQVLDLLQRLVRSRRMSLLLITHNLGVVAGLADRIAVMYAGRIVEQAPAMEFFHRPLHPYSAGLLRSVPSRDHRPGAELPSIPGSPPVLSNLPRGCAFAPRCPLRINECEEIDPPVRARGPGRTAACLVDVEAAAVAGDTV